MKKSPTHKMKKTWTLEDAVHFVIYRELDKLGTQNAYQIATLLCEEMRQVVNYRTPHPKRV